MPKIAVLSTAHIHSRAFFKMLQENPAGKSAYAVWDDVADRGRRYAEEFGSTFNGDLDALLADKSVEGYLICAENTRHLPLLKRVLPLGKPVMCEKPLATNVEDARVIAQLAAKHKTPLISGYFQPFSPVQRGVRKLLREGALGTVTHAHFRSAHHASYGRWFDKADLAWFTDPELAGGGALLDMGTHAVHLLLHHFGPVKEVWSFNANCSGQYPKVDDYGLIQMRFASGVLGRVEAGWVFTGGHGGLEIIGSKQALWETSGGLVVGSPEQNGGPSPVPAGEARPERIARLLATVRGEVPAQELQEDLKHCLDAVLVMAAAYESNRTKTWQPVPAL
jgi:predicted dehydrogenase